MKKKIVAMCLVMSLVCVQFAACGSDDKKDSDKKTENVSEEKDSKEEEETEEKEEETKLNAERGTVEDGVYKNESMGISFPVADNMIVCSDEQIAQTLSIGSDLISDNSKYTAEDMEEAMKGAMYDTIILFSDNSSNVSVIYEDMDKSQAVALDEEQYLKALSNNLKSMNMGYEIGEIAKQDIGGTEFSALTATASGFTQKYCLHQVGNYMIEFIFTYTDASQAEVEDFISSITFESPL